jgi:hypothetical protein
MSFDFKSIPLSNGGIRIEMQNGNQYWFLNGQFHREDGPAIDQKNNKGWCIHGKRVNCQSQQEFDRLIKLKAFW